MVENFTTKGQFSNDLTQIVFPWFFKVPARKPSLGCLTLIGKAWKTHSEIIPKFQFSGACHKLISGKLIQHFFRSLNFRGMSCADFWKIHQSKFVSFCNKMGHDLDRYKYGLVFQKSVFVTPRNSWNIIFRLNALFWISFPEIGLAYTPEICQ